jgi:hypothetical protein
VTAPDFPHVCLTGIDGAWGCVSTCPKDASPTVFVAEIESMTSRMVRQLVEAEENQTKALLREVFEAGRERGEADASDAYWGPPYSDVPEFEEFIANLIQGAGT